MKKIIAMLLALMMLAGVLAGCGKQNDTNKTDKLSIVQTEHCHHHFPRI